jgi:hypothetical protein
MESVVNSRNSNDSACEDHALARELAQLARGELRALNNDAPLGEWRDFSGTGGGVACDACPGQPPVQLAFFCNEEWQITGFRTWDVLAGYLRQALDDVRESAEDFDPEPVGGTTEERAAWIKNLIAPRAEDGQDECDWYFGLHAAVGGEESFSILRCWDLYRGFDIAVVKAFTSLADALAFRASWGSDDVESLSAAEVDHIERLAAK